jgi:RHS repeat-associated protein
MCLTHPHFPWLLGDHLGSTAYTINAATEFGEVRYRAFGATRFTSGTTPTTFRYTGQREESGLGLYYYGARWYDPALGHFLQPDTLVPEPGNVLDYHRYAYVRYNPLKYHDPTGHQSNDPNLLEDDERPAGTVGVVKGNLTGNANALKADVAETAPLRPAGTNRSLPAPQANPAASQAGGLTLETVSHPEYVRGKSENRYGDWGVQQAAEVFGFLPAQVEVRKPGMPVRRYDGVNYLGAEGDEVMTMYVEVKTLQSRNKSSISITSEIKQQIEFDRQMDTRPMWIFVGGWPSKGLIELLRDADIAWHVVVPEKYEEK